MNMGPKASPKEIASRANGGDPKHHREPECNLTEAGHGNSMSGEGIDQHRFERDRRIQAAPVRALCAGISDMTLWRWINERDFPKPMYIGRRRYWREADVIAWLDAQAEREA